ncbi:MAG: AmmeMemoRadiSam system protein B [Patescibacteria group bacterium]|nr:AmmeMemoRadiSam system protein B [Patescibacteria group bacterium]
MKKLLFLLLALIFLTACGQKQATNNMPKKIKSAAVAGQFYPKEPGAITEQIQRYLKQAPKQKIEGEIKAIIVPHAGYDFSGLVAAYAFKALEGAGKKINTAVIISNSHQAYFDGAAIDSSDAWQTPLDQVAVDKVLADKLVKANSAIKYDGAVHQKDHNIEVQLPFLQTVLKNDFKIVPIEVGNKDDGTYKKLARSLKDNLGPDDLVIISSDMSHYPKYEDANKIDKETLEKIKSGKVEALADYVDSVENSDYANEQTALCGIDAVKTVMELANLAGWDKIEILKYLNSGDAPGVGDKSQVVGYGAVAIAQMKNANIKMQNELSDEQKKKLLNIAKQTVENFLNNGEMPEFEISDEGLNKKQGAFVTLTKGGQLRGCIGQIVPTDEPLWQVVRDMAVAACSEDGRFNPVSKDELSKLKYEISVLSTPEPIDDWRKIKLGKHGVIIKKSGRSGVFLPQVATETSWSLEEFLSELCWQKAGLSPGCYKDKDTQILIFTAQVFK